MSIPAGIGNWTTCKHCGHQARVICYRCDLLIPHEWHDDATLAAKNPSDQPHHDTPPPTP